MIKKNKKLTFALDENDKRIKYQKQLDQSLIGE